MISSVASLSSSVSKSSACSCIASPVPVSAPFAAARLVECTRERESVRGRQSEGRTGRGPPPEGAAVRRPREGPQEPPGSPRAVEWPASPSSSRSRPRGVRASPREAAVGERAGDRGGEGGPLGAPRSFLRRPRSLRDELRPVARFAGSLAYAAEGPFLLFLTSSPLPRGQLPASTAHLSSLQQGPPAALYAHPPRPPLPGPGRRSGPLVASEGGGRG